MAYNSQNLGKEGEKEAVNFLEKQGYLILETNWRYRKLEVDIIAKKQEELVIIEVKTRSTDEFGEPEVFVSKKKQKNLIKAANEYINHIDFHGETRFDIISIVQNNENLVVKHIESAFYPTLN